MGWHHLPYRDFLWKFPPFTVPLVALSRVMAVNGFATVFAAVSAARVRHLAPPRPASPRPRADRHDLVVRVRHPVVHHRLVPVRRRHGFLRVPGASLPTPKATG